MHLISLPSLRTYMESMRNDCFTLCGGRTKRCYSLSVFDMRSSGYEDFVWAIELHRFGLELIGLWPLEDEVSRKKLWLDIRATFVFVAMIFIKIPMIFAFIRVWGDMMIMIDNLRITLPLIVTLFKFIIIRWKRKVLLSIVNMVAEDWISFKINTERDVMLRSARSARIFLIFGYILILLGYIAGIICPTFGIQFRYITNLTDRNKPLPLPGYYFYDTDKSPLFELTLLFQIISSVLVGIIYISIDAFLGFVILHICGQLENFRHRLINLLLCKNFNRALSNCVMFHLRLIRFANNIEDTFSLMMLVLVLYFCVIFCLCGFVFLTAVAYCVFSLLYQLMLYLLVKYVIQIITDTKINDASVLQACYLSVFALLLLFQTFLYCCAGEFITKRCEAVYRAICDLEWFKLETRKTKNLIFLIIRANEPFRITAGKIIPLTMATFCNLLKTSAGYISFLLAKGT